MQRTADQQLKQFLSGQGLRSTGQREVILNVFVDAGRHVSAEELTLMVKKKHQGIGYATVYRTLKLLTEAKLADERRFDDGITRYEYTVSGDHHDHLICTRCGTIIEFENQRIEALQQDVARRHKFTVQSHKLELYGLCETCSRKK
jgi:Fur family ferric uptake transcriptional regulator